MATTIAEDDIVRTKVLVWVNYQVGINIRYWRCSTNPGDLTLEDLAAELTGSLVPLYVVYLTTTCIVDATKVQIVGPGGMSDEVTTLLGTAGAVTGQTLPRQACGIVTLTTGVGGRKNRGRFYLPFPTEGMNEGDGSPNAAGLSNMDALGAYYSQPLNVTVGDFTMILAPVIVHGGPAPDAPTPITGFIVRDKWGTQKRRGDYGKLNERLS